MPPVVNKRKREGIQLCKVYEPGKLKFKHFFLEPKFDGIRGILSVRDGKAEALTSTGLPVYNVGHILQAFEQAARNYGSIDNRVFDGEFLNPEIGFNETSGITRKFDAHPAAEGINFYVWDQMTVQQFDDKLCPDRLSHRKGSLIGFATLINSPNVKEVVYKLGMTAEDIEAASIEYIAAGYEGVIIKDADGLYEFRKSGTWLKYKPYFEGDLVVTGAFEGRGKHAGRLGAVQCIGYLLEDKNIAPERLTASDREIRTEVGTGFDDAQREALWQRHKDGTLIGTIIEVQYQELTPDDSLRFPSFYRVRDDKRIEIPLDPEADFDLLGGDPVIV